MKYLCLVYLEPDKLHAVPDRECANCGQGLRERGVLVAAEALEPTETATTVRVRSGKLLVTDGPFAETREQLGGYFLIDVAGRDEALDIVARMKGDGPGPIEIRPVVEIPGLP